MPARTNKLQAVVFYVKEHVAPEGAEVTESKMLVDRDSGKLREVDVVVEHIVGDDPITISVEVIAWSKKASVTWVEQMLSKHQRMPTNRLVLVSWSGFSGTALDKVAQQGGHVEALVPVRLDHDDPTIRFLAPELTLQAAKTPVDTVVIETWCESAGTERLQLPTNAAVFSAETDVEIATLDEVVAGLTSLVRLPRLPRHVVGLRHERAVGTPTSSIATQPRWGSTWRSTTCGSTSGGF